MAQRSYDHSNGPPRYRGRRPSERGGRGRRPRRFHERVGGSRTISDLETARSIPDESSEISAQMSALSLEGQQERRRRPKLNSELHEALTVFDKNRTNCYGTSGSKTTVISNFFKVDSVPNFKIFNYSVDFEPPCESKMVKSKILKAISRSNWSNSVFSFTGQSIHLPHQLDVLEYEDIAFRESKYKIKLQPTGETVPGTEPFLAILGLVLRGRLNQIGFRMIQKNLFDMSPETCKTIEGFQIYPGVKASILPRKEGHLMLCIDRINKIVNQNSVASALRYFDLNTEVGRKGAKDHLVSSSVMTSYNNRFYRVTDIDFDCDATSKFLTDDNHHINFIDYYRDRYHLEVHQPRLPLLMARIRGKDGEKKDIRLIPEFCQIAGLDKAPPAEKAKMMQIVSKETIPQFRMRYIGEVLHRLTSVDRSAHFPLSISKKPEHVEGRYLIEPQPGDPGGHCRFEWRDMGRKMLFRIRLLNRWLVLVPEQYRVDNFLSCLRSVMAALGTYGADPLIRTYRVRGENAIGSVQNVLQSTGAASAEMVVVLMSNQCKKNFYPILKNTLSFSYGVPSQFIKEKNFHECKMSIMGKIGVQISCKTGSEPWSICGGFGQRFSNTMIIGIDCTHNREKSFSAIVCSLNPTFTRCYSRCYIQPKGQELVTYLTVCIKEAIERYKKYNGNKYPKSIIVYRDGIGDGQLECIGNSECNQINNVWKLTNNSVGNNKELPTLTYIVVKKRINSRFFMMDNRNGSYANPNGGLVVDKIVTINEWRDFYLISQKVTQGSATPSHYNILTNKSGFTMDEIQILSFKLCHMYFNWAGAIRVPAMCQYAHKLAYMAGMCFPSEPNERIHELLYYL
ncbi:hypothetical protein ACOME3_002372 [Neoechinorhynchus agilis]